jgi:hypothetical protein
MHAWYAILYGIKGGAQRPVSAPVILFKSLQIIYATAIAVAESKRYLSAAGSLTRFTIRHVPNLGFIRLACVAVPNALGFPKRRNGLGNQSPVQDDSGESSMWKATVRI